MNCNRMTSRNLCLCRPNNQNNIVLISTVNKIGIYCPYKSRFVKFIKQVLQVLYLFYQKNTQHTTIKSDTLSVLFIGFFLPLPFQLPAKSLKCPLQTFVYHTLPYLLQQQPFVQAVLPLFQHVQTSHDFLNL